MINKVGLGMDGDAGPPMSVDRADDDDEFDIKARTEYAI
jgi:hypothetical protein